MTSPIHQFAALGECMLELAPTAIDSDCYQLGYAGDTFNTALYVRRLTQPHCVHVNYFTAVGQDKYSNKMLTQMRSEGIETRYINRLADKQAGLYLIHNQADGEREFVYYRQQSAAREMLAGEKGLQLLQQLSDMDSIYFSGIALAILQAGDNWDRLEGFLQDARRANKLVMFDSNVRLALWPSHQQARACFERFIPYCNVVLSTWEDEQRLYADSSPAQASSRILALGASQVIIKQGHAGCLLNDRGNMQHIPCETIDNVVDTTGAGDAFNAGVIAGLFNQLPIAQACGKGHALAAKVIQHRGAILPACAG